MSNILTMPGLLFQLVSVSIVRMGFLVLRRSNLQVKYLYSKYVILQGAHLLSTGKLVIFMFKIDKKNSNNVLAPIFLKNLDWYWMKDFGFRVESEFFS